MSDFVLEFKAESIPLSEFRRKLTTWYTCFIAELKSTTVFLVNPSRRGYVFYMDGWKEMAGRDIAKII